MTEGMGKTAVCSGCGQPFRIGSARPKFTWKPTDLGEDSWVGVEPPQEKKEIKHCIMCQAPLEEDAIRCLACGANQITGLVHKSRPKPKNDDKVSLWHYLPMRALTALGLAILIGAGVIWGIRGLFTSVAEEGVEMARVRLIQTAAKAVATGMDEVDFLEKFAGKVQDDNLSRYAMMIEAGDPMIRQAAAPLIACGDIRQVAPIVSKVGSPEKNVSDGAIAVLQAIGPRRLVRLSNHAQEDIRLSAALALCHLFGLKTDEADPYGLAERMDEGAKIQRLNDLCRSWPRAVGNFQISIADQPCPNAVSIEQVGRSFYLNIGSASFITAFNMERTFVIPVERWCAATGVAVDSRQIREWVGGTVVISSPFGADWSGEARVTAHRTLSEPPPGCLPIDKLAANQTMTLSVVLKAHSPL